MLRGTKVPSGCGQVDIWLVSSLEGTPTLACLCTTDVGGEYIGWKKGILLIAMCGSSSKPTVLECMPKHFKKGFSGDYGIKMSPWRLCMLCELEWLVFGVNWPPEGTLDLPIVRVICQIITRNPGYPDHFPSLGFRWLRPCPLGSNSAPTKRDRAEFSWPR
jgi:hypothetical protein